MSEFTKKGGAAFSSDRTDWETPQSYFNKLNEKYHFTLDAAASDENHKVNRYFTKENSALENSWGDSSEIVFINPPYGRNMYEWFKKVFEEQQDGKTIVCLVPARTDTKWFHEFIYHKAEIVFIKGRIKYELNGKQQGPAPFPSMIVVYNDKREIK